MLKKNVTQIEKYREQQLLTSGDHEMIITEGGDSLEEAIEKIFRVMRKQVFKEIEYPIIQMETKEVYFQNVKIKRETERFLFLFMPREKVYYTITARIIVKIKYLNFNKEDF